jgi:hypothetical protein
MAVNTRFAAVLDVLPFRRKIRLPSLEQKMRHFMGNFPQLQQHSPAWRYATEYLLLAPCYSRKVVGSIPYKVTGLFSIYLILPAWSCGRLSL